jgi:hypothetical protein
MEQRLAQISETVPRLPPNQPVATLDLPGRSMRRPLILNPGDGAD